MAEKNKWEKIKYEDLILKDKLGKGAFGEVYLSKVKGIEGVYATKKLEKSKYKKWEISIMNIQMNKKN